MEGNNPKDASADLDPVIASYKVYGNPALATGRQLLIMQHHNRQGPLNQPYAAISGFRIKNRSGMVEVDVPISHAYADYDRDKGQRWGGALAKSLAAKNGGTHGLAGGFGVGVSSLRPNKRRDDFERDIDMMDWSEAVRQDRVLRTQTLGGHLHPPSDVQPLYMVGVFKGDQLYLTPATAPIQMRPQLHHIDAMAEQERAARREGASAAAASGVGGGGGGKDGVPATASAAGARAIHMSIKSADSSAGELTTETMADRLRAVQTEAWSRLQYEDDESGKSWAVFNNNLVYAKKSSSSNSNNKGGSEDKSKGKGKEKETDVIQIDDNSDSEQLKSLWDGDEYLKALCGIMPGGVKNNDNDNSEKVEIKQEGGSGGNNNVTTTTTTAAAAAPIRRVSANAKGKSVAFQDSHS